MWEWFLALEAGEQSLYGLAIAARGLGIGVLEKTSGFIRGGYRLLKREPGKGVFVAPPKNLRGFVGREDALKQLEDGLKGKGQVAITGKAVVHGAGGLGKSTLAREFLARSEGKYDIRLWVDAATVETASASIFADLCPALGQDIPGTQSPAAARAVMNALSASGKSALVVFDNVDDYGAMQDLMPEGAGIHLIVTTRDKGYPGFADVALDVLGFETEDSPAVELLLQETGRSEDRAGARALAEALGGLPLALVTAGRLLKGGNESFAEYQTRLAEILQAKPPQGEDYPDSIWGAVKLSYDKLGDDAKWVADIFAWWAPEGLDRALIADAPGGAWWELRQSDVPEAVQALAQDGTRVTLAVQELVALSLLENGETGFEMHRLTAASLRLGQDEAIAVAAAALLDAQYPGGTDGPDLQRNWPLCRRLTPHARAIWSSGAAPETAAMDMLLNQCAVFLGGQDDLDGAIACFEASLALKERRLGEDHRDIPLALGNLAQELAETERRREAVEMIERAISLDETHRPETEDLAARYMQAANIHEHLGDPGSPEHYALGLARVEDAKVIRKKLFGDRSAKMAHCFAVEASIKDKTGDLIGAIAADTSALERRRGGDKAVLAISLHNLGSRYLKAGYPERAVAHLHEALDIRAEIYAEVPEHGYLKGTADWLATGLLVQARMGKNPELREAEAKKICYDYKLDFEQMRADAARCPTEPIIELPD